ncbi:3-oxoacyl-[acyl-carrier protein] reductase [Natronincola peptidivorans]|uniref:3-oxoacyl-[acyl-carrier protein] reductase n=1 Tax=Natronincola peptidivorans TaxID=426128 RepID=A0A1I0BNK4_9FIRM|nr:SDR family NAD(P)-dependent oxidoreductase [Natronincola peptidivorans]SET08206.1 3-oxoacyl-[acyl-carrier protein] reductase [Natronincola peptidivorans]
MDFKDKVVVITGGSQGIGRAIALSFARAKAKVIIMDINKELAEKVQDEITKEGFDAKVYKLDVSNAEETKKTIDEITAEYGKIDVLINNAGIVDTKRFVDSSEKDWDRMININLKGVFNTCSAVFPQMIARKYGKIINIASVAGKRGGGIFGNTLYAASKAGVIGMTKGLAREGGPYGINANAICPGPTNTPMLDDFTGEKRENFLNTIPLRRFADPEDVANVALFLASDMAKHITGEITDVDGGIMLD